MVRTLQRAATCGGPGTPDRVRGSALAGFSLIELLVATLLVVIIFTSWMRISNFQTIRKESLRRIALEKAAGYLDVMADRADAAGIYRIVFTDETYQVQAVTGPLEVQAMSGPLDPVGYVLEVEERAATNGWPASIWASISLYDKHGEPPSNAFSRLTLYMR